MINVTLAKGRKYTEKELEIINNEDFMFKCSRCAKIKKNKEFYQCKGNKKGRNYTSFCRNCRKGYDPKEYSSSERRREYLVNRNFGLSSKEYSNLKEQHNNSCAICDISFKTLGKRLSIDHDHSTGKIRGLLCPKCNTALGLLRDDIKLLEKMLKYLYKYKEK